MCSSTMRRRKGRGLLCCMTPRRKRTWVGERCSVFFRFHLQTTLLTSHSVCDCADNPASAGNAGVSRALQGRVPRQARASLFRGTLQRGPCTGRPARGWMWPFAPRTKRTRVSHRATPRHARSQVPCGRSREEHVLVQRAVGKG